MRSNDDDYFISQEAKRMKKKMAALLAGLMVLGLCLTGCAGDTKTNADAAPEPAAEEPASESTEEPAAQEENTEEPAEPEKEADTRLLVVSFGTSYNDSRDITIGAVENSIAEAFPQYEVRRAFTAQIIIDKLKERDGLEIDNVTEALDRAVADGIKKLIVQPTHLMNGLEYNDLAAELEEYKSDFEQIVLGDPLLTSDADYEAVIKAITEETASYDDGETAVVYMGHGTEAESNQIYASMQEKLTAAGFDNYYVGTVEAEPTLEDVAAALKEAGTYKKVVLQPLMVVAGDHANNDMAGDEEDTWKTVLEAEGYEVECRLQGLGELEGIQKIYVDHVKAAVAQMNK